MSSLRILFLTAHLPVLGIHGGGARMFHNLRILAEKHQVTLLSFFEHDGEKERLPQLARLNITVKLVRRLPRAPRDLLLPKPHEHDEYASAEMSALVEETLAAESYDVVQAEFFQMGQHVPTSGSFLRILTEHEIHFENFRAAAEAERSWLPKAKKTYDWLVQLNYEARICDRFDRVVCMTPQDAQVLQRFVEGAKLRVIPIGVDSDYFCRRTSLGERNGPPRLLYVGNYRHIPNQEAVIYFATEIFPSVRSQVPETEFWIVGAGTDLLRLPLQGLPGIVLSGFVDDLRTSYENADIFVAPIRTGTGMRVKLLEAFSMGMPVVASTLATYGFSAKPEVEFLAADTPDFFAEQTVSLLKDAPKRYLLGSNARNLIRTKCDWNVLRPLFWDLVETHES